MEARRRKQVEEVARPEKVASQGRDPPKEKRSGFCSCKRCLVVVLGLCIFVWAYPSPIDPMSYKISDDPMPSFEGPLAVNDVLKRGKKVLENELYGPEALVLDNEGNIYTGLADGRVVRISKDLRTYIVMVRTGENLEVCNSKHLSGTWEDRCGRPLGMQFRHSNRNELYVADSSIGLLKVNVYDRDKEVLVNKSTSPVPFTFMNDLVELPNGTLLITDSSLKFARHQNRLEALEGRAHGQLLAYEPSDGSIRVVLKDLFFPNGICLEHGGESVLFAETTRFRITRYYFAGSKKGTVEFFVQNLPCWPDNLSPSLSGGYWVGSAIIRSPATDEISDHFIFIRSIIAKFNLVFLLEMLMPAHGIVLELDKDGQVVRSLHDKGGHLVYSTSQILEKEGGELFIGSYHAPFLVRLQL